MSLVESNTIVCNARQDAVYRVICESHRWPELFEPCISVETLELSENAELIRITALVNGVEMVWESRRTFLRDVFSINSKILKPMMLVKSMETTWCVVSVNNTQCLIVLEHNYEISDDASNQVEGVHTREEAISFISKAIRTNSTKELRNIKDAVERGSQVKRVSRKKASSHSIVCDAAAQSVYSIISDVSNWPNLFDSCISTTSLERDGDTELVKIEAVQNGQEISWNTRRTYFPEILRIDFHLPVPMPFLKSMDGQWRVVPLVGDQCVLSVIRNFEMLKDIVGIRDEITTHEQASELVNQFIDDNADGEMRAIKSYAEGKAPAFSTFKTSYSLPFPPEEVYAVLANAAQWQQVLPHCDDVKIIYDDNENQEFIMKIRTPRGTEHFRSIRKCERNTLTISYFQPMPPDILQTHTGRWMVQAASGGASVISEHTIRVIPELCAKMFGDSDLALNKKRVKELIVNNSKATVDACANWLTKKGGGLAA